VGAGGFFLIASAAGEPLPAPQGSAWIALGYLIVAGSLIAFTSFIRALKLLPMPVVMTYAYVNPVIAVFLGWLILGEQVTGWTGAGTALILLGVAGVFREKKKWRKPESPPRGVLRAKAG